MMQCFTKKNYPNETKNIKYIVFTIKGPGANFSNLRQFYKILKLN